MGTLVQIVAHGPRDIDLGQAVGDAFAAVDKVDRLMSFHNPESELSQLNRQAVNAPVPVHPWTYFVLRRAQRISRVSDGVFDITVAPLLVDAGWLPRGEVPNPESGHWECIDLSVEGQVYLHRPVLMDLGGIAKGFAVDVAIHALRRAGCTDATVNAGGDLRRFGAAPEVIHLRGENGLMPVAELRSGAIATSSPPKTYPDRLAQPIGCIMDPKRAAAWEASGSVMVAARTCMLADALTKVAALLGPACESVLNRFGAHARWVATAFS